MRAAPQRDPYLAVPLALGLLLFGPYLAAGLPNTADGLLHVYRVALWGSAWADGALWPRWHTALFQGYGYPLFNFYAPLLYILGALLDLALPSAEIALKAVLLLTCLAYPLGMYMWVRDVCGRLPAVVAAAAYAFATYRFRELYFQGNYAQFLAWAIYPWCFFFWRRLAVAPGRRAFVGAVTSLLALLLAHNISAMLCAPFLFAYVSWQALAAWRARPWWPLLLAGGAAGAISLVFWLPALSESAFTQVTTLTRGYFDAAQHFVRLPEMLAATPMLDARATNPTMPMNFGLLHLVLALLGALSLLRPCSTSAERGHIGFALAGALISTALMLPLSLPVWRSLPFIAFAEFPSRFYGIAFLCSAYLVGASLRWLTPVPRLAGAATGIVMLGLILSVANYQFPKPFVPTQPSLSSFPGYEQASAAWGTTSAGEYLGRWVQVRPGEPAVSSGGARTALAPAPPGVTAKLVGATSQGLRLEAQAESPVTVAVAQFYFPGWQATVNGAAAPIAPCTDTGLICLALPAGASTVVLEYAGTALQRVAGLLALCGAMIAIVGTTGIRSTPQVAARAGAATVAAGQLLPAVSAAASYPPQTQRPAAFGLASLICGLLVLRTAWIAPHTTWFRLDSPAGVAVPASHQVDLPVGQGVNLIGWDLAQDSARQGEEVHLRLYWQAQAPISETLSSAVQIIAGPRDEAFGASESMHPGGVATTGWNPRLYVVDDHYLRIPRDIPPVVYRLRVLLHPLGEQGRIGEQDLVQTLRVLPAYPARLSDIPHRLGARFTNSVRLQGYSAHVTGDELALTLYWQPENPVTRDLQVFVHVIDGAGRIAAQADRQPMDGLYPTTDWLPGEIVVDTCNITLPADAEAQDCLVGLYDLNTLVRIPVTQPDGTTWPNDAVRIELATGFVKGE